MSIYKTLDLSESRQWDWNLIREFIGTEETYVSEVTGDKENGYRFRYISSTTSYQSNDYPSREAAYRGLSLALLRSLIYNSSFSVFVTDTTDTIVLQSERNMNNFGNQRGKNCSELTNKEALWVTQRAFGFMIYRESESCPLD